MHRTLGVLGTEAPFRGVEERRRSGLGVLERDDTYVGKLELARIGECERDDVVLASEHSYRFVDVHVDEVGDEEHNAPLLRHVGKEPRGRRQLGAVAARLGEEKLADDPEQVLAPAARGQPLLHAFRETQQPDAVVVLQRRKREERGDLGTELALALRDAAEPRRGRAVDRKEDVQLAVLAELLDVRRAHASGDVPVDAADVVTGLVLADLLELEAGAAEDAAVRAEQRFVGEDACLDLDLTDPAHDARREGRLAVGAIDSPGERHG